MDKILDQIMTLGVVPSDSAAFNEWLKFHDEIKLLKDNADDDYVILYSSIGHSFIYGVLVPDASLAPPDIEDLMKWGCNPYSSWSIVEATSDVWVEGPLERDGGKTLKQGEQLVFVRSLEGVPAHEHYVELLQKFSHTMGIHYIAEREAWCQLDKHGDIEDIVKVIKVPDKPDQYGGTIILAKRQVMENYTTLTKSTMIRMFDFTKVRRCGFRGWRHDSPETMENLDEKIYYRFRIEDNNASYVRGVQILPLQIDRKDLCDRLWGNSEQKEKQYASFISHDVKNNRVCKISCAPDAIVNYFTESDLPWEMTRAYFRPEVLSKYKADKEKYKFEERSIRCRGSWYLQTYDINEAGQVHTYLIYLSRLPYEEQLHWKQFNQTPKGGLSKRAYENDIQGNCYDAYNPLSSLKRKIKEIEVKAPAWWKVRSEDLHARANYPVTNSNDEWCNELLLLDQLLVEGFNVKWLRKKATDLGRTPDPKSGSLKLLQECLIGLGYEEESAESIVQPFKVLHDLRTKLKGHSSDTSAEQIKQDALKKHNTYRRHYEHIASKCDESMGDVVTALQDV
jgi:hypothetical protein